MTTEVSKWLRKSTLDCIFSEVLLTTDFVEKNNIYAEIEKYKKYAYIDELDNYDSIKELIESTPDENAKYNVSVSQLKRIADSINNETYFEVVKQITKEVIEFRNKILGIEKDNTIEDSDAEKLDLNDHVDVEEKSEEVVAPATLEAEEKSEEVVAPATLEAEKDNTIEDSDTEKLDLNNHVDDEEKSEEVVAPATLESDTNKKQNEDTVIEKKSIFSKLKGGREKNKQKAFKLFAGLMKDAEGGNEDDQHKEEPSSEATVAYQPAVANNLYGNTGVTNQITFSPASDFRTVEEKINELYARLVMETDRNKILYIVNQIINLVPDKEAFKKALLSKLKGM